MIELIMADHRRIRRLCAALEDVVRCPGEAGSDQSLAHVWRRLADLLEAHFRAEEEICYLPMFGCSPRPAERWDAVADHDDIRAAMGEASLQPVGSALWWRAVRAVVTASIGHLDWEERGVLAACLPGLTISQRRELGRCWLAFIAAWTLDATPPARTDLPGGVPLPARHRRPGPT
ncbi:MAG: hemerythrin domain-containing protein [Actinobacteria bacterium]|nr:hemerythrin domain-containing protein [Actinomycetota bacterium]